MLEIYLLDFEMFMNRKHNDINVNYYYFRLMILYFTFIFTK